MPHLSRSKSFPLQQGLKQKSQFSVFLVGISSTLFPLQQGLKPNQKALYVSYPLVLHYFHYNKD